MLMQNVKSAEQFFPGRDAVIDKSVVELYLKAESNCKKLGLTLILSYDNTFWIYGLDPSSTAIDFKSVYIQEIWAYTAGLLSGYELKEREIQQIKDAL